MFQKMNSSTRLPLKGAGLDIVMLQNEFLTRENLNVIDSAMKQKEIAWSTFSSMHSYDVNQKKVSCLIKGTMSQ